MISTSRQRVFAFWYFLVVALLTALLLEHLLVFELLRVVFWVRLGVYATALIFSFHVLGEYLHNKELALRELKRIQRAFTTQLLQKDNQIDDLKQRTNAALKTAAKQAGKVVDAERATSELHRKLHSAKKRVKRKK